MTTTSQYPSAIPVRHSLRMARTAALLLTASVGLAACSSDKLEITNPNTATVAGAGADPQALQLQATGLLRQLRNGNGAYVSSTARFGREAYVYSPQEGRNTTNYLIPNAGANGLDPAGFAAGNWATQYGNLRDIFNFKNTVTASTSLTDAQRRAGLGFAKTIEGLELLYVISTRDTLGAVVEIKQNASDLALFVSRDSVYKYILGTLDEAASDLSAGGAAFPFALHSGFTGFSTPSTFLQFNRAITARAAAYYATSGGGATAWQKVLSSLDASFINAGATTRAGLDAGVYHPHSGSTGDAVNPNNAVTNTDLYAHMSILADVQRKADNSLDDRYLAKIGPRPARTGPSGLSVESTLGFSIYPSTSSSVPIIRNEELILLRAEALLATNAKANALTLINAIRVNSGGLPPSALTAASSDADVLTELLREKRYSLLLEGHRWVDMRRYNRLNQLPLDLPSHFVAKVQPVPQAECLVRARAGAEFAGPGC
jgi:starch-binding outer membrane protein, SusD/RagB family